MEAHEDQDEVIKLLIGTSCNDSSIGVLDLRKGGNQTIENFGRFRSSLWIKDGLQGLANRFSWLPPRSQKVKKDGKLIMNRSSSTKQLVILCDESERDGIEIALQGWDVIAFRTEKDLAFWEKVKQNGLLKKSNDYHVSSLLFSPSKLARIILENFTESQTNEEKSSITLLDLGCGAGRDLVWIARNSSNKWKLTGIDNLQSIVRRARLLVDEMDVGIGSNESNFGKVEKIICAQATSDGYLEDLDHPQKDKTSKDFEKADQATSSSVSERLKDFAKNNLPHPTFDVLFLVRFLPIPLIESLPFLSHRKTWIAISHFTTIDEKDEQANGRIIDSDSIDRTFTGPPPEKRFELHHIDNFIQKWEEETSTKWQVIYHHIEPCEDGRPLRNVIFHRIE